MSQVIKGYAVPVFQEARDMTASPPSLTHQKAPVPLRAFHLPLSQCVPSRNNPRKSRNKEALEELAESIALYGVFQPIVVRAKDDPGDAKRVPRPDGVDGPPYEIVAGVRRWLASRLAGKKFIPAYVRDNTGNLLAVTIALVENLQREALDPIEEARCYAALVDLGMTNEKIGIAIGKSTSYVINKQRLLKLPPPVQEALQTGELTASHGVALLSSRHEGKDLTVLAQSAIQEKQTSKQLARPPCGKVAMTGLGQQYIVLALQTLAPLLTTCDGPTRATIQEAMDTLRAGLAEAEAAALQDANKALVIASPDLLEACRLSQKVEEHFRFCEDCDQDDGILCEKAEEMVEQAEALRVAAIAKAEGREA